jgi:hypothetical protein
MKRVFAWLEPFALAMWSGEIQELAGSSATDFRWSKRTRLIGLYQTVIAERERISRKAKPAGATPFNNAVSRANVPALPPLKSARRAGLDVHMPRNKHERPPTAQIAGELNCDVDGCG